MSRDQGRSAGALVPLFSVRDEGDWGVGELPDVARIAPWLRRAGLSSMMVLPLIEAAVGQDSPYSGLSAFALDPVYVSLEAIPDFSELGGEAALGDEERRELERLRSRPTVDWAAVRHLKGRWLRRCFERFVSSGASRSSDRARDLERFREQERSWLTDYSLFRALKEAHALDWWKGWPPPLRDRDPAALAAARESLEADCRYFEYLQWNAYRQLGAARREAAREGVRLAGDLPFMVAEDSADVWSRRDAFRLDATVGVPPDAYSDVGQDWGLPVYRWDVLAARGYDWLAERGRHSAELFDLLRIDHVVGFYRTFARPRDGATPFFLPGDEDAQRRQGEAVMSTFRGAGVELVAEDLGTVPPFVRRSLASIGVPGYRVLRWEKDDDVFRDPRNWPALSLATTGTHDTEPVASWWDALPEAERRAARALPALRHLRDDEAAAFGPAVHEALLEAVFGSGSDLLILPVQDLFGARERINLPGTVGPHNWSYRLPWTIGELATDAFVRDRTAVLSELGSRHRRTSR
ncbi:4-alpha-glucanotransferase [Vulgatibacter incomptus]|uniref:4-alpha-glucanotransferase n=1 Tax=Vulgatibacter incomptus TaxID=1391653 RepID=A0A0K1PDF3_9BACT|nr:4-alpha-glucanotransferase [Vulgatibacter incomptus]AKU91436.1 4-alpha-glucanotransferase (amylomaltase) [Vulgatibacter incomptus]